MKKLAAYYFFFYLAQSVFMPYLSLYFSDKGFTGTAIGMFLSLWALVAVVSQPVMGMLNDRQHDPLRLLKICALSAPAIGLGFYFFHGFGAILLVAVLFSWFQSSSGSLSDTIAVGIVSREGYAFSKIRLWGALSYSIGAFVTGFIYEKAGGYHTSFLYYFLLSIPVFLLLLGYPKSSGSTHRVSIWDQVGQVCRNRPFLIFVGISLMLLTAMSMNSTFLPLYFKEMGFDMSLVGTSVAIAALIEVPMFWISAKLVAKIGQFPVLCLAAALFALKCLLLFAFDNVYLTLVIQALDGTSFAFFAGISVEAIEKFAGENMKATYQTVFAAVTYGLGGIIGNAAGGVIVDLWGAPFLYLILFVLCATAAVLFATVARNSTDNEITPSPNKGRALS